jgi:hypothetical protein
MIIHRINPESTRIETTEQEEAEVAATMLPSGKDLLSELLAGEAVFLGGFWLFGDSVMTANGMMPTAMLEIKAGISPRSGLPGSCDAHWIEMRQLVKRGVAIDLVGIEVNASGSAGSLQ